MRSYILLRNNRESGPYSFRELKTIGINSNDLIWIDGESTSWTYPTDFEELKPLVETGILIPLHSPPEKRKKAETATIPLPTYAANESAQTAVPAAGEVDYSEYLNEKEDDFHWQPKKRRKVVKEATSGFFGLAVLLMGVTMCAFVVKKLVEHFEFEPYVASSQAIEISKETLPTSNSINAAKTVSQASMVSAVAAPATLAAEPITQSATTVVKKEEVKKKPMAEKVKVEPKQPQEAIVSTESPESNNDAAVKPEEEKKEAPVEKKAPSLSLSANDYKVGVFGGVSNLEIFVSNPSSVGVDKATIEVEFLKPNGSVVKSETLSVGTISPGGAKTISVPSSGRGVKVRYRVVSVDAQ